MITLIALIAGIVAVIIARRLDESFTYDHLTFPCVAIAIVCLAVVFASPLLRLGNFEAIQQIEATKISYEQMREDGRGLESAAIYVDIADMNRKIASMKYMRSLGFTFMYPAAVEDLKYIR